MNGQQFQGQFPQSQQGPWGFPQQQFGTQGIHPGEIINLVTRVLPLLQQSFQGPGQQFMPQAGGLGQAYQSSPFQTNPLTAQSPFGQQQFGAQGINPAEIVNVITRLAPILASQTGAQGGFGFPQQLGAMGGQQWGSPTQQFSPQQFGSQQFGAQGINLADVVRVISNIVPLLQQQTRSPYSGMGFAGGVSYGSPYLQ